MLSTAFLIEHLLFIILFRNFMWWQNSLDVFGCKIDICHISCAITLFSFIALMLELEFHCYCCIYLVFIPKLLVSVTITRITAKAPSLFRLNRQNSETTTPELVVKARSRHRRCYMKKAFLKIFAIFTGKHPCWSLFLIKIIKKWLQHRCFPVNIA